jgi:neutral ceramidase
MNRRQFLTGAAAAAIPSAGPSLAAAGNLRAGAATANISPALGCSMAGGMTDRRGVEIHDELHVRAVALDNGNARIGIAVVDSCAVPRTIIDRAKEMVRERSGVPASHLLVSATHTHTAAPSAHLFQSQPDPKYTDWLTVRIADCLQQAFERLQPARIGWGVGSEPRLVFNRRYYMKPGTIPTDPFGRNTDQVKMNPPVGSPNIIKAAGPVDPDVSVVAVESTDGRPIALLVSYALHYVGGTGPGHISADYFAAWANSVTRLAGLVGSREYPPFVPILANACSGNINGVNFLGKPVRLPPYEQMQKYADILAAECYRTWRTIQFQDTVDLSASIEELDLAVRMPSAAEVSAARQLLTTAGAPPPDGYKEQPLVYAHETVLLSETFPNRVKTFVQALRVGNLGIATYPGEAFVELGLELKSKSPFKPTMLIELANDYRGYIPTVEGHEAGGYETWRAKSSYLEKTAAPKFVASALRQLESLA